MVAPLRKTLLLLAALVASPALLGGEYGLTVGPSFPNPCERVLSYSLNSCATAAVVEELRGHFIAGKPFRIEAVKMAVLSGRISLTPEALAPFNDVIVDICVSESPHDFKTLTEFLGYLPYRSLRDRLAAELERTEQKAIRARLQKALAALPPAKVSKAEAALLAYKRELSDAGDRDQCEEAVQRVGRAMATDSRLKDADIQAEIDLYEKVKGPMPYPTPGTACSLFGFQDAAHAALEERRRKRDR